MLFSSGILLNFVPKINQYWTTFETLTEIERLQRTTTVYGRLVECWTYIGLLFDVYVFSFVLCS